MFNNFAMLNTYVSNEFVNFMLRLTKVYQVRCSNFGRSSSRSAESMTACSRKLSPRPLANHALTDLDYVGSLSTWLDMMPNAPFSTLLGPIVNKESEVTQASVVRMASVMRQFIVDSHSELVFCHPEWKPQRFTFCQRTRRIPTLPPRLRSLPPTCALARKCSGTLGESRSMAAMLADSPTHDI